MGTLKILKVKGSTDLSVLRMNGSKLVEIRQMHPLLKKGELIKEFIYQSHEESVKLSKQEISEVARIKELLESTVSGLGFNKDNE
jgi:hypothetical protein